MTTKQLTIAHDRNGSFLIGLKTQTGTPAFTLRYVSALWSIPAALRDYRQQLGPVLGLGIDERI